MVKRRSVCKDNGDKVDVRVKSTTFLSGCICLIVTANSGRSEANR